MDIDSSITPRAWAQFWLNSVSQFSGATVEPSDVERLAEFWAGIRARTTTQSQLLEHMAKLVKQYDERGRN